MPPLSRVEVPGHEPHLRGKVRDIFDLGDRLLFVATDRVSAYDVVLPRAIPDKGAVLTSISHHWLQTLPCCTPHHLISVASEELPAPFAEHAAAWGPRFMVVQKLDMIPIECVVRGYLAGSGWREYRETGKVCGHDLPSGLREAEELPTPIFTPSTKAEEGHDINITREEAADLVGATLLEELMQRSLEIYNQGRAAARECGVILADTKFEFGLAGGVPILADEVLTPDSSRYWPAADHRPGSTPPSYDKQFVRDYLRSVGWSGDGPPPNLPDEVVAGTCSRYQEIFQLITGQPWKDARDDRTGLDSHGK